MTGIEVVIVQTAERKQVMSNLFISAEFKRNQTLIPECSLIRFWLVCMYLSLKRRKSH